MKKNTKFYISLVCVMLSLALTLICQFVLDHKTAMPFYMVSIVLLFIGIVFDLLYSYGGGD